MAENLIFSNFQDQEFDLLTQLLSEVFITEKSELDALYQAIIADFDQDGWPPHFVERDLFKSGDEDFQATYKLSPSIAIDLPSLFELDNEIKDKATIVILGQDPKSGQDNNKISLGTPYGLHHKGSREILQRTKLYFEMIVALLRLNYRVYLTDIYKIWVCDPRRPYYGIKLPQVDQEKFLSILKAELSIMNAVVVVTWGKESENSLSKISSDIQHLGFPHPSGAANGAWKKLMHQSPTNENKLAYWTSRITSSLSYKL